MSGARHFLPLVLAALLFPSAGRAELLADTRQKYQAQLKLVNDRHKADQVAALTRYGRGLKALERRFKKASDLDGLLALREETKRYSIEESLAALDIRDDVESLGELQKKSVEELERVDNTTQERMYRLLSAYINSLNKVKSKLTKTDKIDQALSVREEIELVMASPEYHAAQEYRRAVEEARKQKRKPKPGRLPKPDPGPKLTRKTAFSQETAMYRKGEEPRGPSKRMSLDFTSRESRAASSRMSGSAALISIKDPGDTSYPNRFIPRLTLSTSNPAGYKNCTVQFEYFVKPGGTARKRTLSEWIRVDEIKPGETLIIDGQGYRSKHYTGSTYTGLYFGYSRSSRSSARRGASSYSSYSYYDFGGILISVYAEDRSLLFQKCSQRGVASYGKPTFQQD